VRLQRGLEGVLPRGGVYYAVDLDPLCCIKPCSHPLQTHPNQTKPAPPSPPQKNAPHPNPQGVVPALRTYNTLIIACNMCNQPREALSVYQQLLSENLQPNSTTCNALISAHGKLGQLDKVLEVYKDMVWKGLERSVITYSSLISACEKAGRWETALQLFDEMTRDGCSPNTVTYNSLITACGQGACCWLSLVACCSARCWPPVDLILCAAAAVSLVERKHPPYTPSQPFPTNKLTPGCQWEKAQAVFDQMQASGCTPDVVTYTSLISAHERGGQWHLALQCYQRMVTQGCRPDVIVYNAIIDALWQTGVVWAQVGARPWLLGFGGGGGQAGFSAGERETWSLQAGGFAQISEPQQFTEANPTPTAQPPTPTTTGQGARPLPHRGQAGPLQLPPRNPPRPLPRRGRRPGRQPDALRRRRLHQPLRPPLRAQPPRAHRGRRHD